MTSRRLPPRVPFPGTITPEQYYDDEDVPICIQKDTLPICIQEDTLPEIKPQKTQRSLPLPRILGMATGLAISFGVAYFATHMFNLSRGGGVPSFLFGSNGDHLQERKPILRFRSSEGDDVYRFKIVQLADLHLGEAHTTNTALGPEQDAKTWELVHQILTKEQPDLIVLSGDQISANACLENATEYYKLLGEKLSRYKIPWAMTFGDYDDRDFELRDGSNETVPAKYTREDLVEVDMSFQYSLTEKGPDMLFGVTNYVLTAFLENSPAAQIYIFDSGGGSLPLEMQQSQVSWFSQTDQRLPAVAFQHVPTMNMQYSEHCMGYHGEDLQALHQDPGIADAMSETTRVYFLAAGHNHGNHYCCPFTRWLQVCMGAHTGYGGYGDWQRGARVYELEMTDPKEYTLEWRSWVRLESGEKYDMVNRHDVMTEKGR
jgi:predicted MPP superfamily phosphohydrolase